jgi:hypothetical protein
MSGIHDGGVHDADLDTRVQAALRVRAERVTLGPDGVDGAWEQTVARKRRAGGPVPGALAPGRHPDRRARRWAAPLAAAASVAIIGAGIGVAASLHPGQPAAVALQPDSATVVSGAAGLTGPAPNMLEFAPPVTQVVLIKQVFGTSTSWTYVWFGHVSWGPAALKSPEACTDTYSSERGGPPRQTVQGCNSGAPGTRLLSTFPSFVGQSSYFEQFGLAVRSVTSVTMQSVTDTHEKIPASLIDGRGFPYKVFVVAFPATTNLTNWDVVARAADGKQDSVRFPIASDFTPTQPLSTTPAQPVRPVPRSS